MDLKHDYEPLNTNIICALNLTASYFYAVSARDLNGIGNF